MLQKVQVGLEELNNSWPSLFESQVARSSADQQALNSISLVLSMIVVPFGTFTQLCELAKESVNHRAMFHRRLVGAKSPAELFETIKTQDLFDLMNSTN